MSYNIIAHLRGDEPIEGEIDELPPPNATFIAVKNPRKRSNHDLEWLDHRTMTLLISFSQIISIEIVATHMEQDLVTKYGSDAR